MASIDGITEMSVSIYWQQISDEMHYFPCDSKHWYMLKNVFRNRVDVGLRTSIKLSSEDLPVLRSMYMGNEIYKPLYYAVKEFNKIEIFSEG